MDIKKWTWRSGHGGDEVDMEEMKWICKRRNGHGVEKVEVDTIMPQNQTGDIFFSADAPLLSSPTVPQPVNHTLNATPTVKVQQILAFLENSSCDQVVAFIGKAASDWNVGDVLWPHLQQQLQDKTVSVRNTVRSGVSGGINLKSPKMAIKTLLPPVETPTLVRS